MSQSIHQPVTGDDYNWDAEQTSRGASGVYITQTHSDLLVRTPSWNKTETVFRPYPRPLDQKNPEAGFEPARVVGSDGQSRYSNWIRRYVCAWKVGNPSTTFLIRKSGNNTNTNDTPLGILYRAINNAVKSGAAPHPEFAPLVMKQPGKSQLLTAPTECYVMQGAILRHSNRDYFGRNGDPLGFGKNPPILFLVSGGAGKELTGMLTQEKQNCQDPNNFEERYVYGDPTSLTSGRYFHFFEKGSQAYNRYVSQPTQNAGWSSSGGSYGDKPRFGFDIYIGDNFEGQPAALGAQNAAMVCSKWREWKDHLYFPDDAQQASLLSRCFPPQAIIYAFDGINREWVSDDVRRKAAGAVSAQVPAHPPQGQYASGYAQQQQVRPAYPQQPPAAGGWGNNIDQSVPVGVAPVSDGVVDDVVDSAYGYQPIQPMPPQAQSAPQGNPTAEAQARLEKARQQLQR